MGYFGRNSEIQNISCKCVFKQELVQDDLQNIEYKILYPGRFAVKSQMRSVDDKYQR
jgi:hypothetical protein